MIPSNVPLRDEIVAISIHYGTILHAESACIEKKYKYAAGTCQTVYASSHMPSDRRFRLSISHIICRDHTVTSSLNDRRPAGPLRRELNFFDVQSTLVKQSVRVRTAAHPGTHLTDQVMPLPDAGPIQFVYFQFEKFCHGQIVF